MVDQPFLEPDFGVGSGVSCALIGSITIRSRQASVGKAPSVPSAGGLGYPEHTYAQQVAQALEMMIVVQHVQPRGLCRDGDRKVGQRQAVGSVRTSSASSRIAESTPR